MKTSLNEGTPAHSLAAVHLNVRSIEKSSPFLIRKLPRDAALYRPSAGITPNFEDSKFLSIRELCYLTYNLLLEAEEFQVGKKVTNIFTVIF